MEDKVIQTYRESDVLDGELYKDACVIIDEARQFAYRAVNVALTLRNWKLGERITREHLDDDGRAEYGKHVIEQLSKSLTNKYGKGFDKISLHNYVRFYNMFPEIVDAVSQQSGKVDAVSQQLLPWTLYRELIRVEDAEARKWYAQEALRETWSSRVLHRNIGSQYYYRLLQSQSKESVVSEMKSLTAPLQDKLEFIKNPVIADFLGLSQNTDFTETELEESIITHIQKFIMEMGKGFAFVARQKHIRTDMGDFYIDLVFYNYILKCFFLMDLKTSQITHQDVGQMDMYVRMYDSLQRTEGDNPTIGLLLCSDTSEDMARYSVLHGNEQIFQAKYLTYLPTKEELVREIELQKEVFRQQHEEA
ncbi:MAG: PDDEXK nuclease domain-containing protein [Salinivirgaceae bacterium]|nr:PDDEXK nuclease domain-containing protein [Salinivirgaceae bacterium]